MDKEQLTAFGSNAGYLAEMYQMYIADPSLVSSDWAAFFEQLEHSNGVANGALSAPATNGSAYHGRSEGESNATELALRLADAYRRYGHLRARINPVQHVSLPPVPVAELDPAAFGINDRINNSVIAPMVVGGQTCTTIKQLMERLAAVYTGSVGFEYMHIDRADEREWLRARIEENFPVHIIGDVPFRKRIYKKLVEGDLLESELHKKYVGTKRFSLEGSETLIPVLDAILQAAAGTGIGAAVFGMAHRGRLNVLANTLGKPLHAIFAEFEDQSMATVVGAGDVKYHLGYDGVFSDDNDARIDLMMVSNPSHLEFVNPVVEGVVRAVQDRECRDDRSRALPILMHGDAAFAGQGIVFETINLSLLDGYATGGTVHIVINNQIGFTTTPDEARSTTYCTDLAKGVGAPVFHVNGEDPDAACWIAQLALDFRNQFGKDVIIDLIGFRKHGHNEGDDPSFTQPLTYAEIKTKKPVWQLYGEQLVSDGVFSAQDRDQVPAAYREAFAAAQSRVGPSAQGDACSLHGRLRVPTPETGVSAEILRQVANSLVAYPEGFVVHPKLAKIIQKRVETVETGQGIEWGVAEALAFGSLVLEGIPVRLSGQDCGRGTFSQRHLVLDDYETLKTWSPLADLGPKANGRGLFEVYNSSLSEAAVVGFEFGYSATNKQALVLWEAQFGDFSNGAQVLIDQFIASSEAKWCQLSGVTLLLPHGYEGQGPEHSSARLERFLQLCGEGNMCVCYPTTSAQHFHLLRRQALLEIKRPLIVMTPKSLLRLPSATSSLASLTTGSFQPVIEDDLSNGGKVEKIVMLSGKVFHDVYPALKAAGPLPAKIVRIEQLHPFPQFEFKKVLKGVTSKQVIWAQEEPQNMGAWSYIEPYLTSKLKLKTTYVGREAAASTATGSPKRHAQEQKAIVEEVLSLCRAG